MKNSSMNTIIIARYLSVLDKDCSASIEGGNILPTDTSD